MVHFKGLFITSLTTIFMLFSTTNAQMIDENDHDDFQSIDEIKTPGYLKRKSKTTPLEEETVQPSKRETAAKSTQPKNSTTFDYSNITVGGYVEQGIDRGGFTVSYLANDFLRPELFISPNSDSFNIYGSLSIVHAGIVKMGNVNADLYWGPLVGLGFYDPMTIIRAGIYAGAGFNLESKPEVEFFINIEPGMTIQVYDNDNIDNDWFETNVFRLGIRYSL